MKTYTKSIIAMDTRISIQAVSSLSQTRMEEKMNQAFSAFRLVESICSRFDPGSEVMRLMHTVNTPVPISRVLFEAISFAYEVAALTNGIFDPTVGQTMEKNGFNRHYLSGQIVQSNLPESDSVSYLDVVLDPVHQTVLLQKPLILDLGAVAKGLAVDLAAKELQGMDGFAIDAGGDVLVSGVNGQQGPWTVGIRHPLEHDRSICVLRLTNTAVCTSGSYERKSKTDPSIHHLIQPQTHTSPQHLLSATVIAPFAMMADALSTAVFLQNYPQGLETLAAADAEGVFITPGLDVHMTKSMERYLL
jgi:FAD:protein FMN transferase